MNSQYEYQYNNTQYNKVFITELNKVINTASIINIISNGQNITGSNRMASVISHFLYY